jgi:hypothetical protein
MYSISGAFVFDESIVSSVQERKNMDRNKERILIFIIFDIFAFLLMKQALKLRFKKY